MTVNAPEDRQSPHVPIPHALVTTSSPLKTPNLPEAKVNGRLITSIEVQPDQLSVVAEENAALSESPFVNSHKSSSEFSGGNTLQKSAIEQQRRSDEKIIAEILRPEERMRVTINSDKMLKVTGIKLDCHQP